MKFSNPVKKEYNGKLYQFRNIINDDGSRIIINIDRNQADVRIITKFNKQYMIVDLHKYKDVSAIMNITRKIESEVGSVKSLFYKGKLYFNKVNKDFNALHIRSISKSGGTCKLIVDPITV